MLRVITRVVAAVGLLVVPSALQAQLCMPLTVSGTTGPVARVQNDTLYVLAGSQWISQPLSRTADSVTVRWPTQSTPEVITPRIAIRRWSGTQWQTVADTLPVAEPLVVPHGGITTLVTIRCGGPKGGVP